MFNITDIIKGIHVMKLYLLALTFRVLFKSVLAIEVSITLGPTKYKKKEKRKQY